MTSLEASLGPFQEEPICPNTSSAFLGRDAIRLSVQVSGIKGVPERKLHLFMQR